MLVYFRRDYYFFKYRETNLQRDCQNAYTISIWNAVHSWQHVLTLWRLSVGLTWADCCCKRCGSWRAFGACCGRLADASAWFCKDCCGWTRLPLSHSNVPCPGGHNLICGGTMCTSVRTFWMFLWQEVRFIHRDVNYSLDREWTQGLELLQTNKQQWTTDRETKQT